MQHRPSTIIEQLHALRYEAQCLPSQAVYVVVIDKINAARTDGESLSLAGPELWFTATKSDADQYATDMRLQLLGQPMANATGATAEALLLPDYIQNLTAAIEQLEAGRDALRAQVQAVSPAQVVPGPDTVQ